MARTSVEEAFFNDDSKERGYDLEAHRKNNAICGLTRRVMFSVGEMLSEHSYCREAVHFFEKSFLAADNEWVSSKEWFQNRVLAGVEKIQRSWKQTCEGCMGWRVCELQQACL